jgi:hypothetical protein
MRTNLSRGDYQAGGPLRLRSRVFSRLCGQVCRFVMVRELDDDEGDDRWRAWNWEVCQLKL